MACLRKITCVLYCLPSVTCMIFIDDVRATVDAMHKPRCGVADWPTNGQVVQVNKITSIKVKNILENDEELKNVRTYMV